MRGPSSGRCAAFTFQDDGDQCYMYGGYGDNVSEAGRNAQEVGGWRSRVEFDTCQPGWCAIGAAKRPGSYLWVVESAEGQASPRDCYRVISDKLRRRGATEGEHIVIPLNPGSH